MAGQAAAISEVTAGIVAHPQRRVRAALLQHELNSYFPTTLFMDTKGLGCNLNHLYAWETTGRVAALTGTPWCLILEDDAAPIAHFGHQLDAALSHTPAPVVSPYLGRGRPAYIQPRIERAISHGRPWIVHTHLLHCVAVCVRTELVMQMTRRAREAILSPAAKPIDEAITEWAREQNLPVAYTNPSLVEHADIESVNPPQLRVDNASSWSGPRVAWQVGVPDRWSKEFSAL